MVVEDYEEKKTETNEDMVFDFRATLQEPLDENLVPLFRDPTKGYKPLERHFGTITSGMAFGESCMFGSESRGLSEKPSFFNAIALTECYFITLSMHDLKETMKSYEDQIEKD